MKTTLNGPWLSDAPEGWDVRRLSRVGRIVGGGTPSKSDSAFWEGTIPWASPKDIKTRLIVDTKDHISERGVRESSTTIVPSGTLLIVTRSGILRHRLPVAIATKPLALNQDLKGLIPHADTHPDYLAYWIEAHGRLLLSLWRKEGTTVESLETDLIKQTPVPLPPPSTQRAIASFLDRETRKIDTLIEKKRRLLELLEEKRTALITRAVTKGLDPDVPMKDSGVEWLGEIPEHWEVVRLTRMVKRFFDYRGRTPRKLDMEWGGEIPAISALNVRDGYVDFDRGLNRGSEELYARWMKAGDLTKGDILFTTEAPLGHVAQVPDERRYILSQRVIGLKTRPHLVHNPYLSYLMRSQLFQQRLRTDATGSTTEGISRGKLSALQICLPPIPEQTAIADNVTRTMDPLSSLQERIRQGIPLLQEYRTALTSAAVTGKIDVIQESAA